MPALVGGFGIECSILSEDQNNKFNSSNSSNVSNGLTLKDKDSALEIVDSSTSLNTNQFNEKLLGSYLAGLIEGDGTFALHENNSTGRKYRPKIIICFKKADYALALYLQELTKCGAVYNMPSRGYILWQIQDIVAIYTIINIINGYMRTPKIEGLNRTIHWLNNYIANNQKSKLPSTKLILSKINIIEIKSIDNTPINSNAWFSGFSDADSNFSINIHKRSNSSSTRVQLFYRLEIKQTHHRLNNDNIETSFFPIMSKVAFYLESNVLSRSRVRGEKQFNSFILICHSKNNINKIINYFNQFPLLSSKHLEYKAWVHVFELQQKNSKTSSYLEEALNIRKDFNSTRTTYNWNHLKSCYLTQI
jgi:hypothetical protein